MNQINRLEQEAKRAHERYVDAARTGSVFDYHRSMREWVRARVRLDAAIRAEAKRAV